MQQSRFISRLFAFLFILLLTQKVVTGLYIHNDFHTGDTKSEQGSGDQVKGISCSCIDDFLTAFDEPAVLVLTDITTFYPACCVREQQSPCCDIIHTYSLRGPPAPDQTMA